NFRPSGRWDQDAIRIARHVQSQVPQLHDLPRSDSWLKRSAELPAMRIFVHIALFAAVTVSAFAQPVVAPTPETVGTPRGDDVGGYNVINSFEAGYRFADIDGNRGKYRSDVNYLNGIRLFSSSLAINSKDGHGGMFHEIILNTQGLGYDPYE